MAKTTEFTVARGMTIQVNGDFDKPFYSVTKVLEPGDDEDQVKAEAIEELNAMLLIIHESDAMT